MKRKSSETSQFSGNIQNNAVQEQMRSETVAKRDRPKHRPVAPSEKPSYQTARRPHGSSFQILPIEQFNKSSPYYRQPVEIGGFSLDENRKFHDDKKKLRKYKPPSSTVLDFDLRIGYKSFVARDEDVAERLDHLLQWINLHRNKFELPGGQPNSNAPGR